MTHANKQLEKGFTVVEILVAMSLGLLLLGAGITMFKAATNVTQTAFSRSDMQQNARGAIAIITRDLSQASIGIPQAGITLPSGGTGNAVAGCGPNPPCALTNGAYPNNLLAPVVPFDGQGANGSDAMTITYIDNTWPDANKAVTSLAADGSSMIVDTNTYDSGGNAAAPPAGHAYNDAVLGSKVGDVMMIFNTNGYAVSTVTGVGANGLLSMAGGDPLSLNQLTATGGNVKSLGYAPCPNPNQAKSCPSTSAARINVVTYSIKMNAGPDGVLGTGDDYPVLYRQINAQNAIPLTDYVSAMTLSYDIFNSTTNVYQAAIDGSLVPNAAFIRKINISLTLKSNGTGTARNETYTISTAISPRDLSFQDRY